ncbi:unnamed protein product [Calypogeia fissa]
MSLPAGESIQIGVQTTTAVPDPECSKPVVVEAKKETKTEPTKAEVKRPETMATGSEKPFPHQHHRYPPIYALSADTPGSGPMEETGLDGYLKKPINWDMKSQLISQIQAAKDELYGKVFVH